jgi:hypothetical protein
MWFAPVNLFPKFRPRTRPRPVLDPLEDILIVWPTGDPFTCRHLVEGGVAIMGRSGSGKSSGSLNRLAKAIIARKKTGGLINASSPTDRKYWTSRFAEAGRPEDLLIFGPGEPYRFNFLDAEMAAGGDTRNITRMILTVGELRGNEDGQPGDGMGRFWAMETERWLYNAVEIVKLATGRVTVPDLHSFISTAATSPDQLLKEDAIPKEHAPLLHAVRAWRAGFHNQAIAAAYAKPKTANEQHGFDLITDQWLNEWPAMADKTRSSIVACIMGILHVFCVGECRELLSTTSNVSPALFEQGKWVLVDWPVSRGGAPAAFTNGVWKLATQKYVLRRNPQPNDCIIVIICDEFPKVCNPGHDSNFLAECRKYLGCMIVATQSLHSFYSAVKGQSGEHAVEALLTNFGLKIFHALGDAKSAEWGSGLLARYKETFISVSDGEPTTLYDELTGHGRYKASISSHYEPVLQPGEFFSLATGGPANGYWVDGIVVRSGEPFSDGKNYQIVGFNQR